MRVDACTNEVKECLTAEDRCGEDYTQCIGLDTDTIVRMCPFEKLVACADRYKKETQDDDENASKVKDINEYEDEVYNYVADIAQGIFLNIDNNFMTECQNALDDAMIKVCGDTENCDNMTVDDGIGTRSLEYKICEFYPDEKVITNADGTQTTVANGAKYNAGNCRAAGDYVTEADIREALPLAGIISGMIFWENVSFDEDGKITDFSEYLERSQLNDAEAQLVKTELDGLQTAIERAVSTIEADPKVQYCMTGRQVQGMAQSTRDTSKSRGQTGSEIVTIGNVQTDENGNPIGRFPNLTKQIGMIIANSAIQKARENYYKEYDKKMDELYGDFKEVNEKMQNLVEEDLKNARREAGRVACMNLAKTSSVACIPQVEISAGLQTGATTIDGATLIIPITSGANNLMSMNQKMAYTATGKLSNSYSKHTDDVMIDTKTVFDWDKLVCNKCTTQTICKKHYVLKKRKGCKKWHDPQTKCQDIPF